MSNYMGVIQHKYNYLFKKLNLLIFVLLVLSYFQGFTCENEPDLLNGAVNRIVTIKDLPDEVKVQIVQSSTFKQRALLSQVNKEWNTIANDPAVWKVLAKKKYPLGFDWLKRINHQHVKAAIKFHVNLVYLFADINKFEPVQDQLSIYNKIKFDIKFDDDIDSALSQVQTGLYVLTKNRLNNYCIPFTDFKKVLLLISLGMANFPKNLEKVRDIIEKMAPSNDDARIMLIVGKYCGILGFEKDHKNTVELSDELNQYRIKNKENYDPQVTDEQNRQEYKKSSDPLTNIKTDLRHSLNRINNNFVSNKKNTKLMTRKTAITRLIHPFGETINYIPMNWLKVSKS